MYTLHLDVLLSHDFVKAAMNAISTIFQNAQRRGRRFHLGQSLWHRIQTLGRLCKN